MGTTQRRAVRTFDRVRYKHRLRVIQQRNKASRRRQKITPVSATTDPVTSLSVARLRACVLRLHRALSLFTHACSSAVST